MQLEELKNILEEKQYPYFEDDFLLERVIEIQIGKVDKNVLLKELLIQKSSIQEIKLGDIHIPSPRLHFLEKAQLYHLRIKRSTRTGQVVRADGR